MVGTNQSSHTITKEPISSSASTSVGSDALKCASPQIPPRTDLWNAAMAVQIGAKPLASFDRPLDMLVDCHRRVEYFLGVLIRVEALYRGKALDAQAILAFNAAQLYYQTSAPKQTLDEEEYCTQRVFGGHGQHGIPLAF